MSATFRLDRTRAALFDAEGRRFDPADRTWRAADVTLDASSSL